MRIFMHPQYKKRGRHPKGVAAAEGRLARGQDRSELGVVRNW